MSKEYHDPLVIGGKGGSVPNKEKGGIDATRTKIGPNGFMIEGLYGGKNPSLNKSFDKFEPWDVQTDFV